MISVVQINLKCNINITVYVTIHIYVVTRSDEGKNNHLYE